MAKILIVESDPDTLDLNVLLVRHLGHEPTPVRSFDEALAACEHQSFDLVLCDISLPGRTGWDLMRELRRRCDVRGIALSGHAGSEHFEQSHEAGFYLHLVKPVTIEQLETAIDTVLPEQGAAAAV